MRDISTSFGNLATKMILKVQIPLHMPGELQKCKVIFLFRKINRWFENTTFMYTKYKINKLGCVMIDEKNIGGIRS